MDGKIRNLDRGPTVTNNRELADREIAIPAADHQLYGFLDVPPGATGVVAFAHGSGSGRFSTRNQYVAQQLNKRKIATLLLDLLDESEVEDRQNVFDIDLLADRVILAARWLRSEPRTRNLPLGYFGASTGAGAALVAAAREPSWVSAVVSRGGRPDLAGESLTAVRASTLLIVGENDDVVVELNQQALNALTCIKDIAVVPAATHLFPEPGALEEVARLAGIWFLRYLRA